MAHNGEIFWTGERANKNGKRARLYLLLDCETATLPFANEIAKTAKQKKDIAIAKPLIYDLAWQIVDRYGRIYARHSYLITETFAIPSVFDTAYYREKRPIYLDRLNNNDTCMMSWRQAIGAFLTDMEHCDYVGAFNSMFDFKKAIPFTELYINHLYSINYKEWEDMQREQCIYIAGNGGRESRIKEYEFDPNNFFFRNYTAKLIDLWGITCAMLINSYEYKRACLENGLITASGEFFKTSVESSYRYLNDHFQFVESHTALDDVIVESTLLVRALKRGKIPEGIIYFPFRELGTTADFLRAAKRGIKRSHFLTVIIAIDARLEQGGKGLQYLNRLEAMRNLLYHVMDQRFPG